MTLTQVQSEKCPRAALTTGGWPILDERTDVAQGMCSVEGCESPAWARGWCGTHYRRWQRLGSVALPDRASFEDRFWAQVERTGECWEWRGKLGRGGYGQTWRDGRAPLVHRVSWELHYGPIPEGLFVCHRCDNPPCVRPDHLFLGTAKENTQDMMAKGRFRLSRKRRGEEHPRAKLTAEQAGLIRARVGTSRRKLAEEFGVSPGTIRAIHEGRTWKDVR